MTTKVIEGTPSTKVTQIQRGITTGIPIMLGYLPIAIAYGVLAKQAGLSIFELTMMSVLVYAGAAQFMGAGMIALGTGAIEIIVATFVLNFRHFVMSLSFMNRLRGIDLKWKVPLSLGLTDESFSVASLHGDKAKQENGTYFYAALMLTAYLSWVIGSCVGGLLGDIIPETLSQSMGVALYAMFIGLLVPSVKKEVRMGLIAIIAMLINYIFSQFVAQGWAIVIGTVIGGLVGIYVLKEEKV
ncbi:AzlC family ABC transporter permease [Aquibacillus koreensis]|uniref:AzlC family ABC transporter permease n=1 Tax=Aquibacillus koreensis TaxID=279446 RepID=A0A9X3WI67_9BACI|nr:AzlC family ABC transporter permease [Aquibacillus koreensis]MCT2535530.1 AzlC family ABC transporter permease [Aquibacillus koreensis]MDC3420185.1 AzlC family ABC transporter permease [Aquibacillus koreensis]